MAVTMQIINEITIQIFDVVIIDKLTNVGFYIKKNSHFNYSIFSLQCFYFSFMYVFRYTWF